MSRWMKPATVLAGYTLALLVSLVAVAIYDRHFTPEDNQAMGGMIAGGELIYGVALFLVLALAPTGLAFYFMRRHRSSWSAFAMACLAYALGGVLAVVVHFLTPPLRI